MFQTNFTYVTWKYSIYMWNIYIIYAIIQNRCDKTGRQKVRCTCKRSENRSKN